MFNSEWPCDEQIKFQILQAKLNGIYNNLIYAQLVQSMDTPYTFNVFSFILMTTNRAVSHWRPQNYIRTYTELWRKNLKREMTPIHLL